MTDASPFRPNGREEREVSRLHLKHAVALIAGTASVLANDALAAPSRDEIAGCLVPRPRVLRLRAGSALLSPDSPVQVTNADTSAVGIRELLSDLRAIRKAAGAPPPRGARPARIVVR